jgi:acetoin utilization deacetylase AcuC-like enzyme
VTILFRDDLFLRHDTGPHPETPRRLVAINGLLEKVGLAAMCATGHYQPLAEDAVATVHAREQVELVKELSERGGGMIDADTIVSPESYRVALAAAGACCSGVDAVMSGDHANALCLVRPPGHHATQAQSMGFCLFNNIALAARHAIDRHGLSRVLIVDWDVHHGNGTQDIFYESPDVLFYSIHRYGHGFYPGTGAADEIGSGRGLGYTLNVPIRHGTSRREYHDRFLGALQKAADKMKPELVLISAGFDAHVNDPIGSLGLETEDFATMTRDVLEVARTHAGGRVVSCLEGGYNLSALAKSVQAHLEQLLDEKT